MEAIVQEIEVERLLPIFDIPKEIWNSRVEVTIKPIEKTSHGTTAEKILQYRKKYNREVFIDRLKEQTAKGHSFSFDVQKVIDGTETEEETQVRYRLEKQTWGKILFAYANVKGNSVFTFDHDLNKQLKYNAFNQG